MCDLTFAPYLAVFLIFDSELMGAHSLAHPAHVVPYCHRTIESTPPMPLPMSLHNNQNETTTVHNVKHTPWSVPCDGNMFSLFRHCHAHRV